MYTRTHMSRTALGLLLATTLLLLPIMPSHDAFAGDIITEGDAPDPGPILIEAPETAPSLEPPVLIPSDNITGDPVALDATTPPPVAPAATENMETFMDVPEAPTAAPTASIEETLPIPESAFEILGGFEPEIVPEGWVRTDDAPMDVRDVLSAMNVYPVSLINGFSVQFIEDGLAVTSPTENAQIRMTFHIHLPEGVPAQLREGDRYAINRPDTIVATGARDMDLMIDDVIIGHVSVNDGPLEVTFYDAVRSHTAIEMDFSIDAAFVPGVYAPGSQGVFSLPGEDVANLSFTMAGEDGTQIGEPENLSVPEYAHSDGSYISGEGLVTGFALTYHDNTGTETDTPAVDASISATMSLALLETTARQFSTGRTYQITLPQTLTIPEAQTQTVETGMGTLATAQIGPGKTIMVTFAEDAETMIGQPATLTFTAVFDADVATQPGDYILTIPNEILSPAAEVTIAEEPARVAWPDLTETNEIKELGIGDIDAPQIAAGETFTLHLPIAFAYDEGLWHSNSDENGDMLPYDPANEYGQKFAAAIKELQISVADTQADDYPLSEESLSASAYVIQDGKNEGYAVLDALQARAEAAAGTYPVQLDISWQLADGTDGQMTKSINIDIIEMQGEVDLGTHETPVGQIGASMLMALPITYTREDGISYESNEGTNGQTIAFGEGNSFDQTIAEELSEVTLQVADVQAADFPFDQTVLSESEAVLDNGVNEGYAVFDEATIREDALPGAYTVNMELAWQNADGLSERKIVPLSIELTGAIGYADGVIVFTYQELKNALNGTLKDSAGQPYNTIYLGYCDVISEPGETVNNGIIQLGVSGATVPRSVTIVGTDPRNGRQVKLVDVVSSAPADTIRAAKAGITITLQDAEVQGNNVYGILYSDVGGVAFTFNNVHYTGRQMAYNRGARGLVSISNCNIRIQASSAPSQEVAEACEVRLSGNVQIDKVDSEAAVYSLFWLTGQPNKITVEPSATVTANTVNYFTYIDTANSTVDIQGVLSVSSGNGNVGCMGYADQTIDNLTVGSGGALALTHNGTSYASLRANNLTVDGTLVVERPSASSRYCLSAAVGGTWNFNNPPLVKLTNPGGRLMNSVAGTTTNIKTEAANLWKIGAANEYVWYNNDMRSYTVTLSGVTPNVSVTNLDSGRGAALPAYSAEMNSTNFAVRSATQLILGLPSLEGIPKAAVELVAVPTRIDFGMVQTPSTSVLVPRGAGSDSMEVVVLDTRDTGTWTLELQVTTPLTQSGSNDVLTDALVFVTDGGSTVTSLLSPLTVHQQTTSTSTPAQTTLSWGDTEGILLRLQPLQGIPGNPYIGAMTWTVTVAP